jgi:hypothetical protein
MKKAVFGFAFFILFSAPCFAATDGSSPQQAIPVRNISNCDKCQDLACLKQEYGRSIDQEASVELPILYGRRGADWNVVNRALAKKDGKFYDEVDVKLKSGETKKLFFDISAPAGKLQAEIDKRGWKKKKEPAAK